MYAHGWYQVAFENELTQEITGVSIGKHRLILVRTADGIRAFQADCPHRGVHLMHGKLDGKSIICPFHSYRIGLARSSSQGFGVAAYPTIVAGGLIFVRLSDSQENGFTDFIKGVEADHTFIPGFVMPARTTAALVTENGFDSKHFPAVHRVPSTDKFVATLEPSGEMAVRSMFDVPNMTWIRTKQGEPTVRVPFLARTFSPGLIAVRLDGELPYWVLTGATPTEDGYCVIRLSLLLPKKVHGDPPNPQFYNHLLKQSKLAVEDDRVMWESISPTAPSKFTSWDEPILEFHKFCQAFV